MSINPGTTAAANPTKAFFVRMLTRDISLEDCILDLIDNSVDAAWEQEGSLPIGLGSGADLSKYRIEIDFDKNSFKLKDNCGGMSLKSAQDHAFSFGRSTDEHDDFSIGVYGIGMKRAIFKLGNDIQVRSTTLEKDGSQLSFAVKIDVVGWMRADDPPWTFPITTDDALEENGVSVEVQTLTSGASAAFDNPAFKQGLRRLISRDYSFHIARGLKIFVGGTVVSGWTIELRQSEQFQPVRLSYEDESGYGPVTVEMIGGMAAPPPEENDPDESDEGDQRFGWYVVCNGRIVLAADKTQVAGWGTQDWPQWHYQYAGFIGLVFFTAPNANALPLTTTKRSVDTTSDVFRRARPKMRDISRRWIDYTNARKQSLEDAKRQEDLARPVPLQSIIRRDTVYLPTIVTRAVERKSHINYSVSPSKLKKLASAFGSINMTNRDVGTKSFEYAYSDLVGEE